MKRPTGLISTAAITSVVAAATMFAIGWRNFAGIIVASLGAGLLVGWAVRVPGDTRQGE